jgi:hypothetical protein
MSSVVGRSRWELTRLLGTARADASAEDDAMGGAGLARDGTRRSQASATAHCGSVHRSEQRLGFEPAVAAFAEI